MSINKGEENEELTNEELLKDVAISHEDFIGVYESLISPEDCELVINMYETTITMPDQFMNVWDRKEQTGGNDLFIKDKAWDFTQVVYGNSNFQSMMGAFHGNAKMMHKMWASWKEWVDKYRIHNERPWSSLVYKFQRTEIRDGSGYHVWHWEHDADVPRRFGVWSLYLNDVEEGGETEFLYYGRRIKPTQGTMVVWPAHFTHTHRGNPPISNNKNILTGWLEYL